VLELLDVLDVLGDDGSSLELEDGVLLLPEIEVLKEEPLLLEVDGVLLELELDVLTVDRLESELVEVDGVLLELELEVLRLEPEVLDDELHGIKLKNSMLLNLLLYSV